MVTVSHSVLASTSRIESGPIVSLTAKTRSTSCSSVYVSGRSQTLDQRRAWRPTFILKARKP